MHHMITSEQQVTDRQNIVERAGEEEEQDHTCKRDDDGPVVSLDGNG